MSAEKEKPLLSFLSAYNLLNVTYDLSKRAGTELDDSAHINIGKN